MTALNFWIRPHQAIIAADTLTTTASNEIGLYTSKLLPLPHLHTLICGTGKMPLIMDWFVLVSTGMILRTIADLDQHTPTQLYQLAKAYPLTDQDSTTIYHIGYDPHLGRFRAFAYRSTRAFASEELPGVCWAIRPQIDLSEFEERMQRVDETTVDDFLIDLMERQQALDAQKPRAERVGIGGEIHIARMDAEQITITRRYRFPDYETHWPAIWRNLAPPRA